MKTETLETAAAASAKTTVAGAGITGFGWVTSSEFFGLVGVLVAVASFVVTWYFKREANKRHEAEHELRMQRLRMGLPTDVGGDEADE